MVGLIRLILILGIFILIIRWLSRPFMPNHSEKQQNRYSGDEQQEGKTTIKFSGPSKKEKTKDKGEYVDFEEIE
jgi:hypothetical protein